ncbi:MAG: ATP-binding cassette domain-containing protein [Actinobacteria bacterium]|nr:ATP-binding cassette domain-containing protein [Actinomycetota bacterium]
MTLKLDGSVSLGTFTLKCEIASENEIIAVTGSNGVGKTTLLRVLAGLVKLTTGSLVIDGQIIDDAETDEFVPAHQRNVSMVFQNETLLPFLTVCDNIAFPLRMSGMSRSRSRELANDAISSHGISNLANLLPRELSGGQAQRVALIRAFIGAPKIVLLDEPLSALDENARPELRTFLREQMSAIVGYKFLVTHDRQDVEQICDREIRLN